MKNITRMVSDYVYEAESENGNKITMDTREKDERENQSPPELLLSALSACVAVDIVLILKKKRKTVKDLIIETVGTRRDDHPKAFTKIHLKYILISPDTSEEIMYKVSKLALEKYCTVSASLKPPIKFSTEVRHTN